MDKRIARALAAGTIMALPLLGACGASTAPAKSSAAPVASAPASSTTSAAATPSASGTPADETKNVQAASEKFIKTALTLGYTDDADTYAARVEPLMTKGGWEKWKTAVDVEKALEAQKTKFGEKVRSTPRLEGRAKVSTVSDSKATVAVKFESQIQQRRGSSWKVVKRAVDDTAKFGLVHQDGAWLVDDLS
jgi:hypothetical protein